MRPAPFSVVMTAALLTACGGGASSRPTPCSGGGCVVAISAARSANSACALLESGEVKCWGSNSYGQLGNAEVPIAAPGSLEPVAVSSLAGASAIAVGEWNGCALVGGGAVKCWGDNTTGQLGNGSTTGAIANWLGWTAEDVAGLTGVSAISAASWHTCALVRGKGVKCWGANTYGDLGDGTTIERHTPVDVVF
jgi:alpha-tubulin suppressor-like RCC1 family protein